MSKTKTIRMVNFKAITEQEINLNGCSALITARNGSGKTSLLRGLADRLRGQKPEIIVRQGEKEGVGELELTTGEKFKWEFDVDGKDKLEFYTKEGYKSALTKALISRFFPPLFDIDKFMASQPKEQAKLLQKTLGIDLTDIEARYKKAYEERTAANTNHKTAIAKKPVIAPEKVEMVDVSALTQQKKEIEGRNKPKQDEYTAKVEREAARVKEHNEAQKMKAKLRIDAMEKIEICEGDIKRWEKEILILQEKINLANQTIKQCSDLPKPEVEITADAIEAPELESTAEIEAKIANATETNAKAQVYMDYEKAVNEVEETKRKHEEKDGIVKAIEQEKKELIAKTKLPAGIEITEDVILVNGLPMDKNQLSSSALVIAALKLASIGIGEVRTLAFDASTLDKISLGEVEKWANENDLQLLIERPDFDAGDIKYELIENE